MGTYILNLRIYMWKSVCYPLRVPLKKKQTKHKGKRIYFKWTVETFSCCISVLPLHKYYINTVLDINHNNLNLHDFMDN